MFKITSKFLTIFILLLLWSFKFPTAVSALSLPFVDHFDDGTINGLFEVKNFTLENSGSYGPYGQLNLEETGHNIKISGVGIYDVVLVNNVPVGWIGKSLILNQKIDRNMPFAVETKVNILQNNYSFGIHLTIEFDPHNRITLDLGTFKVRGDLQRYLHIALDENNTLGCVAASAPAESQGGCLSILYPFDNNQPLTLRLEFNPVTRRITGKIDGNSVVGGTYNGLLTDPQVGLAATVRFPGDTLDARFDYFRVEELSSPTPTPTPTPLAPVVIIPGMGASWNYEALVHNNFSVPDTGWKIAPFVKIYDGIISSLKTAGYEEGKNLFIYSYDWRRTLTETASNFADFISNTVLPGKPPETKVNLVSHSLGGLLARTYLQNAGLSQTDKLITLGSPHKGTAKVYPLWEGADFSDYSGWQGLLMRLYLRINRRNFENDVAVVQNLVPSLQNIWPTFNFIKDSYGKIKPNSNLSWSNNLLPGLDPNLPVILPLTRTISGSVENSTTQFFKTVQPSKLDEINNRWKDGKPVGKEFAKGDNSVLLESSQLNGAAENISLAGLDHGQIISLEIGQNEILRILEATSSGVGINQPNLEKAIIAAVASPATFEITDPNGVKFSSQDDLLIIDNPVNGNYQLKLTGTSNGEYRLFFGRINGADEAWEEKSGTVSPGQSSSFTFPVDLNTQSLGGKPLLSAWEKILNLQQQVGNWKIDEDAKEYILDKLYHYQHHIIKLYNLHHNYSSERFDAELIKIHFDIEKFVKRLSTKKLFRNLGSDRIENVRQVLRLVEEDLEQERGDRFGN